MFSTVMSPWNDVPLESCHLGIKVPLGIKSRLESCLLELLATWNLVCRTDVPSEKDPSVLTVTTVSAVSAVSTVVPSEERITGRGMVSSLKVCVIVYYHYAQHKDIYL